VSKVGFFDRADTMACFSTDGSLPVVVTAASKTAICFSNHVGIGSSWQCFVGALASSLIISSTVTGWKLLSFSDEWWTTIQMGWRQQYGRARCRPLMWSDWPDQPLYLRVSRRDLSVTAELLVLLLDVVTNCCFNWRDSQIE